LIIVDLSIRYLVIITARCDEISNQIFGNFCLFRCLKILIKMETPTVESARGRHHSTHLFNVIHSILAQILKEMSVIKRHEFNFVI